MGTISHARARHRLVASAIAKAGPGKHYDGGGLCLTVRESGGRFWTLRYQIAGRRRDMGLGTFPGVSLAEARRLADRWRAVAASGRDPVKVRDAEARAARRDDITLAKITADAFEARKAELKGDGKAGRWLSPLETHVLPKLGKTPVTDIDQRDIKETLAPLWHAKHEVARKALNRIAIVLRHAAALGIEVDLQACDKARALLGKTRHRVTGIPAMPWADVPGFYASLSEPTPVHLCLRLLILTGVRSANARHIRLDEIDGDVWTVPAEAMKGRVGKTADFRVPLSREALAVIEAGRPFERGGYLFPGRGRGVLSDMSLSRTMERRGLAARPHGFRSSLRTWLAEATDAPHEVAETVLQHITGNAVSRAYQRSDFLEQRRALLERWADHVTGGDGRVVRLAKACRDD